MKSSISVSRGPAGHFFESGLSRPMPRHSPRLPSEPPGLNPSLQASIAATEPHSEPPGMNLRLQASIWAWRLQSGFNLSLDASISVHSSQSQHFPACGPPPNPYWNVTHSLYDICLYWTKASGPFFPIWDSSKVVLKYSPTDLDFASTGLKIALLFHCKFLLDWLNNVLVFRLFFDPTGLKRRFEFWLKLNRSFKTFWVFW